MVRLHLKTLHRFPIQISGLGLEVDYETPYKPVAIPSMKSLEVNIKKVDGRLVWTIRSHRFNTVVNMAGKPLALSGSDLSIAGQSLPRNVYLYPISESKVHIVAEVNMEAYLLGVLASEVPASWPLETLKAQAVATRSYTLHSLYKAQEFAPFHLKTSVLDQVYKKSNKDRLPPIYRQKILKAIQETTGQFLVDRQGKYLKAYYHSDCGGHTEIAGHVWPGAHNMGTTKDRFCPQSPHSSWTYTPTKLSLTQSFYKNSVPKKWGLLEKIVPLSKTPSGRHDQLNLVFESGKSMKISGQKLREWAGFFRLKSTYFELKDLGAKVRFKGKGNGHGVGLCQWGSKSLGERGQTYLNILKHYYPLSKVVRYKTPRSQMSRNSKGSFSPSHL